ncbi:MAG: hypothetical protein WBB74_07920 [Gaiellaceae bacterium]
MTRRELLAGAAAGALGAAGIYELVDRLSSSPERPDTRTSLPEQHLLDQRVIEDNAVEVVVPPLHHQVVTAKLVVGSDRASLRKAQRELEDVLTKLDAQFVASAAGLGVTVGWGLPYFRRYVPALAAEHVPLDLRASRERRRRTSALLDAIRFPSDPDETMLEQNDVAVLLRSDNLGAIAYAAHAIFGELGDLFRMTSVRKGFAGGGFGGGTSLPKQMAVAAGVRGADLIPDGAELFLGFTSTQREGLGPPRIANLETLGYTHPGYFRHGTHMHVSHVLEDLEAWYLNFDFRDRVNTAFRPALRVQPGTQTVRQAPKDVSTNAAVVRDFHRYGSIGHSSAIQLSSRLQQDVVGADGTVYRKGTAIPHRADFNTLDNPFFWSADPKADGFSQTPAAGVHFVVFNPTSDDFHRNRLAMDGVLPDGTRLPLAARARGQGINSVLRTTHRQNFLVPPRKHRSFPLAELL